MKIQQVLSIPVEVDEEHPSCSFVSMGYEEYDEDGYPWWYPIITMNPSQVAALSQQLGITYEHAYEVALAHERGHALSYVLGENFKDEELAWHYAKHFTELDVTALREHALASYL